MKRPILAAAILLLLCANAAAQMTPAQALTAVGLGAYVPTIFAWITLATFVASAATFFLPVASATDPAWYRHFYGVIAWIALNGGKNSPTPINGQPAGGLVPAPPKAVATLATTIPASALPETKP